MATFQCEECGHSQSAPDKYIGKHAKCPECDSRGAITGESNAITLIPELVTETEEHDHAPVIRRCSGGSIQTSLGYGIVLNKHSSITREWITVSDPNFPTQLVGDTGIKTIYEKDNDYGSGNFYYEAKYSVRSVEPIQALEVRFLTFNIWGLHDKTLSALEIQDMTAEKTYSLDGKWNLFSENEASEYYASIAFVSQIRTSGGKVLIADTHAVLAEAKRMSEKFSESDLEPTKPPR